MFDATASSHRQHDSLRGRSRHRARRPGSDQWWLDIIDVCLLIALAAIPFLMGGRLAFGRFVLVGAACAAALAWALRQTFSSHRQWRTTHTEFWFLSVIGLLVLQIVPLPANILNYLSPTISKILPAWGAGPEATSILGDWSQLSLTPEATQRGLVIFLSYAMIFFVTIQRVQRIEDVERFLKQISLIVSGMALFGLVQFVTSNGKFYWFFDYPLTTPDDVVKGSFTNRSHFAHFMALGMGPLIWWLLQILNQKPKVSHGFASSNGRDDRRDLLMGLVLIGMTLTVFACLRSLSRAGMIGMFVAGLVCTGLLYWKQFIPGRLVAALSGISVFVIGVLFIHGSGDVAKRLDFWSTNGRRPIWAANAEVIAHYPILGTGVGSHAEAYRTYYDHPFDVGEYTHAECGLLQVTSESGFAGLALAVIGIGLCLWWCVRGLALSRSGRISMALAAITGALIANLVHSTVDFVWYAPGCMVVITVLAASACRLYQMAKEEHSTESVTATIRTRRIPRFAWMAVTVGVLGLSVWMVRSYVPVLMAESHWFDYLRLTHLDRDALAREQQGRDEQDSTRILIQRVSALRQAVKADPDNARFQARMAMTYLSLFNVGQWHGQNPMALSQIRDAALMSRSQFQAKAGDDNWIVAQNEWVGNAVGDNYKYLQASLHHARRALSLCPLQGRVYLDLADLAFLVGAGPEDHEKLLNQAIKVRPYNGRVLYVHGRDAWLAGEPETAIKYWKDAFHRDVVYQERIMDMLVDQPDVPATYLLRNFEPDFAALERLTERYALLKDTRPEDYRCVLAEYGNTAIERAKKVEPKEAVACLLQARKAFDELGQFETAYVCLQSALKIAPNAYSTRRAMAGWLYSRGQYARAIEYLAWCSKRKPRDEQLRQMMTLAMRNRLKQDRQKATAIAQPHAVPRY